MRIDLNPGAQPLEESNRPNGSSTAATTRSAENIFAQDRTQLSDAHAQVQTLVAEAAHLPEIRQEKVQSIRQAMAGGIYRPVPQQTAGAMLADLMVVRSA